MNFYLNTIIINTDSIWQTAIGFFFCFILGSILMAKVISKIYNIDVSKEGSGNLGASNVLRVLGKKASLMVFVWDFSKSLLGFGCLIFMIEILKFDNLIIPIALMGVVFGHVFSIFNGFKGGKGVAAGFGYIMVINWVIGLIAIVLWFIIVKTTNIVALASVLAAIFASILSLVPQFYELPVVMQFYDDPSLWWITLMCNIIIVSLVVFRHRENLKRIWNKEETKIK